MKALKIVLAILIPVAIVCGVLPFVYPLVTPVVEGGELDFGELFKQFFEVFSNFSEWKEAVGFPIFVMLAAFGVGGLLFILWLVFSIVKRRPIGILFGIIAALVLEVAALGVFINMTYNLAIKLGGLEENSLYTVMEYVALGAILLFIASFVVHVMIMFKAAKARKEAKKAKKAAKNGEAASSASYEVDYNDLPPVLFEEHKKQAEPDVVLHRVEHIEVGPNHVLKGHYVRDDEIEALLASKRFAHEEEIPESILEFLDTKHRAEESGESLPMFDPNFVPTREEADLLTEEERFVLEALRNYQPKRVEEEPVPESVIEFLNKEPEQPVEEPVPESVLEFLNKEPEQPVEEPVDERVLAFLEREEPEEEPVKLPIFDPSFVPQKEPDEFPEPLSNEELRVVRAMSELEPKKEEEVEYVDLPFFREHEEPVEFVEEIIRVKEPFEEEVDAPKLANAKPVHLSKNKEGKYQLKQVGEEKAFVEFDTEEEAIKFAEAVKRVNGVSVRVHDDEGKIRSL